MQRSVQPVAKPKSCSLTLAKFSWHTCTNEDGRVVVPLKYVGGDWGQNSAIVPVDVQSAVQDTEIEITVVTSVADWDERDEGS